MRRSIVLNRPRQLVFHAVCIASPKVAPASMEEKSVTMFFFFLPTNFANVNEPLRQLNLSILWFVFAVFKFALENLSNYVSAGNSY
jgi:hypothetical protein